MRKTNEYFGPQSSWDYDGRTDQLFEWAVNCGEGVMRLTEYGPAVEECYDFCLEQYERFKIPVIPEIREAIVEGMKSSFLYVDYIDPYALFWGIGDVEITDDWSQFAYEIKDGRKYVEVDPESIETYVFLPGRGEESFEEMMSKPGLQAIPGNIGFGAKDVLDGEWYGDESAISRVSAECRRALEDLCRRSDGVVDYTAVHAYFELSAWASMAWIVGPLSRHHRVDLSDVYAVALRYGECIMVDGSVIAPTDYRRLERPPKSCHKCGISSWCTELVMTFGAVRYLCENCLSAGMPPTGRATCGSKLCMLVRCPHHPHHGMGAAGLSRAYRDHGQLVAKRSRGADMDLLSEGSRKLLQG